MSYFPVENDRCINKKAVYPYPSYGAPAVGAKWHSLEVKPQSLINVLI